MPCAPQLGYGAGSALLSLERARRGYVASSSSLCVSDLIAEFFAHCRFVSGHDLFEMVAVVRLYWVKSTMLTEAIGENGASKE